jgi:hypothetical protein
MTYSTSNALLASLIYDKARVNEGAVNKVTNPQLRLRCKKLLVRKSN